MALITLGGLGLAGRRFPQRQALLLLTYLKIEGRRERAHLADLFWPEAKNPLNNLSSAMTRLRGVDPTMITADRYTVAVDVAADFERFLDYAGSGQPVEALDLYHGRFLDGVALDRLGLELEEWVLNQRASLAAAARDCAIELADQAANRGDGSLATTMAERALDLATDAIPDPEGLVALHRIMVASNSPLVARVRSEAIDLGADPASLSSPPARPQTPSATVDHVDRPFFDREAELEALSSGLQTQRLVSLEGLGGVGKTQLARRLIEQMGTDLGPHHWVAADRATSIELLPEVISQVIGPDQDPARTFDDLAAMIGDRALLLTLDGLDRLANQAAPIGDLVTRCPNLIVLITSRTMVEIPGVEHLTLGGLPARTADGRQAGPAVRLFQAWFQRRAPIGTSLDLQDPAVDDICRQLDGLPLAIELAAGWLSVLTPAEIADDLRRSTELLADPEAVHRGEHGDIDAVMDRTWRLLDDECRDAIIRLSIFPSGFDRAAAHTVGRCSLPVLRRLAGWSLLSRVDDRHYRCHRLVRTYARAKLSADADRSHETGRAHAHYLLDQVTNVAMVESFEAADVLAAVEDPVGNLGMAWHWLLDEMDHAAMIKLLDPMDRVLGRFGRYYTLLDLLETSSNRLSESDSPSESSGTDSTDPDQRRRLSDRLAMHRVWLDLRLGSYDRAAATADRLLSGHHRSEATDAHKLEDSVLVELSRARAAIDRTGGDVEAAIARLLPAREAAERESPRLLALVDDDLGLCQMVQGDYEASRRSYRSVLAWARDVGSQPMIARTLLSLGVGHHDAGELLDSMSYLVEAKSVVVVGELNHLEPYVDVKLARAHLAAGEPAAARRLLDGARPAAETWEPWLAVEYDIVSARLAAAEGTEPDIWTFLERALSAAVDLNDVPFVAKVYVAIAELAPTVAAVADQLGRPDDLLASVAADGSGADAADQRSAAELVDLSDRDGDGDRGGPGSGPVAKPIMDTVVAAADYLRRAKVLTGDG
jgi:predicted ATPase